MNLTLPKWQLHLCVVKGTPVRVHFSLIALIPLILISSGTLVEELSSQITFLFLIVGAFFVDAAIQAQIASRLHLKMNSIVILPLGAYAQYSNHIAPLRANQIRLVGLLPYFLLALVGMSWIDSESLKLLTNSGPETVIELTMVCCILILLANLFPLNPQLSKKLVRDSSSIRSSLLFNSFLVVSCLYMQQYFVALFFACLLGLSLRRLSEVQALSVASRFHAEQAMIPASQLLSFPHGMLTSQALSMAVRSEQQVFPIFSCSDLKGFVSRRILLSTKQFDDEETYIRELAVSDYSSISPESKLSEILAGLFEGTQQYPIFVIDDGEFKGLLLRDQLIDFLVTQKN